MALDTAKATVILRDLTAKFDKGARAAQPFYPQVTMRIESTGADEKYGLLGDVPQMREWLGSRKANEVRAATYTLVNKLFEGTETVEKTDLADDRVGLYGNRLEALGRRGALHPDKLLRDLLVAAESTACFDGQYFFDTDHSWGDSGTQDNDLTYNASDENAVTAAEFLAASEAAIKKILGYKDDQGETLNDPVVGRLSDLLLIVPLALRAPAIKAYEASVNASGATNVIIDRPQIVCMPGLSTGTKFYTLYLGDSIKPFIFQAREPLTRGIKGLNDMERKDVLFMTQSRYAMGFGAWWNACLTTFT